MSQQSSFEESFSVKDIVQSGLAVTDRLNELVEDLREGFGRKEVTLEKIIQENEALRQKNEALRQENEALRQNLQESGSAGTRS